MLKAAANACCRFSLKGVLVAFSLECGCLAEARVIEHGEKDFLQLAPGP